MNILLLAFCLAAFLPTSSLIRRADAAYPIASFEKDENGVANFEFLRRQEKGAAVVAVARDLQESGEDDGVSAEAKTQSEEKNVSGDSGVDENVEEKKDENVEEKKDDISPKSGGTDSPAPPKEEENKPLELISPEAKVEAMIFVGKAIGKELIEKKFL